MNIERRTFNFELRTHFDQTDPSDPTDQSDKNTQKPFAKISEIRG